MIIPFNKKIYPQRIIKRAIKDWSNLANFKFSQNKNYFLVKVEKIKPELKDNFSEEFSNYLLSLIKK